MRRRLAILLSLVLLVVLAGLALTWIPSDHYIVLPDRARPTDPLVEIPGEQDGEDENGIYMVDVRVGRANLLERIFPGIHEGATLLPEACLNPQGVSDTQRRALEPERHVALAARGHRRGARAPGARTSRSRRSEPRSGSSCRTRPRTACSRSAT